MQKTATYYYVANVDSSTVEIPILSLTPSEHLNRGWESHKAANYEGLRGIVGGAGANERLSLLIPRYYLTILRVGSEFGKLNIWTSSSKKEGSYGHIEYTLAFKNVTVMNSSSLGAGKYAEFPAPAECFRNHFENMLSASEFWKPIIITLSVDRETNIYRASQSASTP